MTSSTTITTDPPEQPPLGGLPAEHGENGLSSVVTRLPGPAETDPVAFLKRRRRIDNLLRFGVPALLILAWQLSAMVELIDERFFPAPTDIARACVDAIETGVLQEALWISVRRLLLGFALGSVVGILVGFALGVVRPLRVALDPVISALYTVPKLALLPLLLLIFGLGDMPKVLLVAMSIFFIIVISTVASIVAISESYREPARSFGASPLKTFGHVLLPAVLPEIFVSLRIAAGMAVLVLLGIEFVQGGEGLGYLIWNSWQLFLSDRMYVGIVTVALLGVVFQTIIKWIGQLVTPWARSKGAIVL